MKLVSVDNVTISTATVDIQVMRIGSKQMTLAVFRQLQRKDIFDECGKLLAPPWGWMNYERSSDKIKPFVFSYQDVLYRSDVNIELNRNLIVRAEIEKIYYEGHHGATLDWVPEKTISTPTGEWIIVPRYPHNVVRYIDRESPPLNCYFESERGAEAHVANRLESIASLEAAPQLFIAV